MLVTGASFLGIRDGAPMVTMLFLGPGRGDGSVCDGLTFLFDGVTLLSDGDPTVTDTPSNTTGDDYYGAMSLAAFTAAVRAAREVVDEYYGGEVEPVLVLVSHSDGITLAAQYAAQNGDAIALVDVEGPVDALEKTVATECFDYFGAYVSPGGACTVGSLPGELDYPTWSACTGLPAECGSSEFFPRAWARFFRPPDHYLGRHNTRALLAAARSGRASAADLFWLKDAGEDPVRFSTAGVDADTLAGLLEMSDQCGPQEDLGLTGAMLEIDLARWAFQAWQEGLFPYRDFSSCLSSCESSPYDLSLNGDARTPCVEACLRGGGALPRGEQRAA